MEKAIPLAINPQMKTDFSTRFSFNSCDARRRQKELSVRMDKWIGMAMDRESCIREPCLDSHQHENFRQDPYYPA